jgi:hypothetical protein
MKIKNLFLVIITTVILLGITGSINAEYNEDDYDTLYFMNDGDQGTIGCKQIKLYNLEEYSVDIEYDYDVYNLRKGRSFTYEASKPNKCEITVTDFSDGGVLFTYKSLTNKYELLDEKEINGHIIKLVAIGKDNYEISVDGVPQAPHEACTGWWPVAEPRDIYVNANFIQGSSFEDKYIKLYTKTYSCLTNGNRCIDSEAECTAAEGECNENNICCEEEQVMNCKDTDGGIEPMIKGLCSDIVSGVNPDTCATNVGSYSTTTTHETNVVNEWYCDADTICVVTEEICPQGTECLDGECVSPTYFAPGDNTVVDNTILYRVIAIIVIASIGGYYYYTKKK